MGSSRFVAATLWVHWLILLLVALPSILSSDAANYLYGSLPAQDSDPVLEYEAPEVGSVLNEMGEDAAARPNFLYSPHEGNRVVLYYMPWCPHCRAYVPTYIALARRVEEIITQESQSSFQNKKLLSSVRFYAVSCQPNHQVCKEQHVHGVPGIKIFRAGSADGVPADPNKLHPFQIMRILGIPFGGTVEEEDSARQQRSSLKKVTPTISDKTRFFKRSKSDLYGDAYRSFYFAMKTEVFVQNGVLPEDSKKALADWLLLLQDTLPTTWSIQLLLADLVANFETITQDESNLLAILVKYPPKSTEWSPSCTKGVEGMGYMCGLWGLFHIMTVGMVEFNENVIAENEQASYHTEEVANVVKSYIQHFFGCLVCREHFIQSFDSCAYDRCHRLVKVVGDGKQFWVQLPLWLWQEHNGVNVRLLQERAEEKVTRMEEEVVQWPLRANCPKCWQEDGTMDEDIVYSYLLQEYWPPDTSISARSLVDKGKAESEDTADKSVLAIPLALLLLPFIGPGCLLVIKFRKRREKKRRGRSKKLDL
ncbi:Sulfhydryl oxidase 1 [Seminavis robusta]|uniref:Sulfhydryl oxidase n=1 Tax=Seminavis robusta TaxID=568900 RepID=A0A9N8F064_9STRA|nr:Sulfhydryl oxidase 1 [Seminavis robusta]|eukprot:Sro2174_g317720.1 Sulfhydryl oxidase 1 (536) ;mRNA; r:15057-16664